MTEVEPFRVLVVCVGNLCRSPLVERLLRHRLEEAGAGSAYLVESAGLEARPGLEMQWDAAAQLIARGGDAKSFRSRPVTVPMAVEAGLVLAATTDVRRRLLQRAPAALRRTFTVRELAALVGTPDATDLTALGSPADLVADACRRRGTVARLELDLPDPMDKPVEVHAASAQLSADAVDRIAAALVAVARRS